MLYLNDIVCRIKTDGNFDFGRVMIPSQDVALPSFDPRRYVPVAWCSGSTEIIDRQKNDGDIGIASRKLKPGDRIKNCWNGNTGHVVGVREFATLQSTDNPEVIYKDVPVERLSTIMKFYGYPGVHILYDNWIGMVLSANRRITYSHNDDIFFSVTDQSENAVQVPPWMDPYSISNNSMLYPGKQFIFTKKMWQQGKFDSIWGQVKSLPLVGKVFVVESIEVIAVSVQWLCPADINRQDENGRDSNAKPENVIEGNSLYRIRNLSVPSCLLATNGSGRIFQVAEDDIPITDYEWQIGFAKEVLPQQIKINSSDTSDDEPEKKKMKLDILPNSSENVTAQILYVVPPNAPENVNDNLDDTTDEKKNPEDTATENINVNNTEDAAENLSGNAEIVMENPEDNANENLSEHSEMNEIVMENPEDNVTENLNGNPETNENAMENPEDNAAENLNGNPETNENAIENPGDSATENLNGNPETNENPMENAEDNVTENLNGNPETNENAMENPGDNVTENLSGNPETNEIVMENPGGNVTENLNGNPEANENAMENLEDNVTENLNGNPEEKNEKAKENPEENADESINEILRDSATETVIGKLNVTSARKISESRQKNAIVVKVLFLRQVANVLYDDATAEQIVSSACVPFSNIKREEQDFLFPFGCWVKRKRCQFNNGEDSIYGIVIQVISAIKCVVKWTQLMDEKLPSTLEECWNFDLLYHPKFNSLCRGGIVLWDVWQCGVILDNLSSDLKITVRTFSGEILKMEPHHLRLIEYHGFWDVLQQKWLVRDLECYLHELRMNPYDQSDETFANHIQVFENVPSSHTYYTVEIPYGDVQGSGQAFANTILKEFYFLQENLPDGIWVQFYVDRLDLISAVIRGAKGTPYESVLFFFDIKIPIMYPSVPPQVRLVTFGEEKELNPNIDSKGFICSSLLETVPDGCYLERWTKISNIMQILLSIQGLYLCEHPLFNKPAYSFLPSYQQSSLSKSIKDLGLSRQYNNNTICTNLVLYYAKVLRSPPSHWRLLIMSHVFESLEGLLKRMKDAKVIPTAFSLEPSNGTFDKKTFSAEIVNATIHLELILQDVKENKWQLCPRISTKK